MALLKLEQRAHSIFLSLEGNLGTLAAGLNCSPSLPTSRARRWQSPGSPRLEKYLYYLCQKQRDLRRQSLGPTTHPPQREASQERNRSCTATGEKMKTPLSPRSQASACPSASPRPALRLAPPPSPPTSILLPLAVPSPPETLRLCHVPSPRASALRVPSVTLPTPSSDTTRSQSLLRPLPSRTPPFIITLHPLCPLCGTLPTLPSQPLTFLSPFCALSACLPPPQDLSASLGSGRLLGGAQADLGRRDLGLDLACFVLGNHLPLTGLGPGRKRKVQSQTFGRQGRAHGSRHFFE